MKKVVNKKQPKIKLQLKNPKVGTLTIPLKKANWNEDSSQLIHTGEFSFDETTQIGYSHINNGDELILSATDSKGNKRKFYFFVESVTTHFEQDPNTGKELMNEVIIQARSFPSILTKNFIGGEQKFSKGLGELVRKLCGKYRLKVQNVKLKSKRGKIWFRRMTILEAIRRMAKIQNWCFYFRDKEVYFGPCKPPKSSGVTITGDEMISGTFTK